jgi:sugar (pentulose or hexulose) kinase
MSIISIDLGTTNIKVAAYTNELHSISLESIPVAYFRDGNKVEFDPIKYFNNIENLITLSYKKIKKVTDMGPVQIVLTGQAESLVVLDKNGSPIRNAISWLDMRSEKECAELSSKFDKDECYNITGQPKIIPTWPLTKILWLKRNEPDAFSGAGKFLLLKDYIIYRLTGRFVGEHSIYPFSHYFDIHKKCYWQAPLEYCGIRLNQLPELVEPCSVAGEIQHDILIHTELPEGSFVNAGTLDHFAGMIGTGNVNQGLVSESAGTVSSIATFTEPPFSSNAKIPVYCGPFPDSYIYLPVCESGGISLEWFRDNFINNISFKEIDKICSERKPDSRLSFLPYLTGVNPPEFDKNATGVFFGVNAGHDKYDFALAIMYGVASLLRKNIDYYKSSGIDVKTIISTGGGAKSALWTQIKADICNLPVVVPNDQEAPCLGAAIIGAVASGQFPDYSSAIDSCVKLKVTYYPRGNHEVYERKYNMFCELYDTLIPMFAEGHN